MTPVRNKVKRIETISKRKEAVTGKRKQNQIQTSIQAFLKKEGGDRDKDLGQSSHTTSLSQGRCSPMRAKPGALRVAGKARLPSRPYPLPPNREGRETLETRKEKKRVFGPLERWLLASGNLQDPDRARTEGAVGKESEVLNPKVRGTEGRLDDRERAMDQGSQGLSKKEEELGLDPGKEKHDTESTTG